MHTSRSILLAGLAVATSASASEIRTSYTFAIDGSACSAAATDCRPWGEDLVDDRKELHPVVPVRVARILLPAAERLVSVEFAPGPIHSLEYTPELAGRLQPLSSDDSGRRAVTAYAGGEYPAGWYGTPHVTTQRGYQIVEVPLYPLRVLGDGTADYVQSGDLTVHTAPVAARAATLRGLQRDLVDANLGVDDPMPMLRLPDAASEGEGYLIIGATALIGTDSDTPLQPLIADKRARGLRVQLAALEKVSPSNNPAEIRAFIKSQYQSAHIDYVLLVGDLAHLAWKSLKAGYFGLSEPIPSDQYYACLDGDFSKPQTYDWGPEVAVGRIGVQTREQVAAWVSKTLALQAAAGDPSHRRKVLNFGEKIDERTLGGWDLDWLITGRDAAPKSVGFPATTQFTKLYETFDQEQSADSVVTALNNGDYHIVNHIGHATQTHVLKMDASRIGELRSRPAFYYTQGCYANDPESDNWTIQAVRAPGFGPAAMIANTRYGWYEPGKDAEGPANRLHRAFWSMRFGGGTRQIGKMNHQAKVTLIGVENSPANIYTGLESNLIGDPELDLGLDASDMQAGPSPACTSRRQI